MGWASEYIEKLKKGETVQFRPTGGSMKGHIESGQLVQVSPPVDLRVDDIVLCQVGNNQYLHFIKNISVDYKTGAVLFEIRNAHGHPNGWIKKDAIYGILDWVKD